MNHHKSLLLAALCAAAISMQPAPAPAEIIYFLVGEWPGQEVYHDSYVLPLEDPTAIAHARDLITLGPEVAGDPIVVAQIAAGADGINRDWLAPGHPEWSWHVTQFDTFAFATIEILDGNPQLVEDDVDGWIQNTNGYIGFWGYTVIDELAEIPEPSLLGVSVLALMCCLRFRKRC